MVSYPDIEVIAPLPLSHLVGDGREYWAVFESGSYFMLAVSFYFVAQSLYVLGSAIWPKNAFVKTTVACVVVAIVYVVVGMALTKFLIDGHHKFIGNPPMSDDALRMLVIVVNFVVVFFNWTVAYFRFKEAEIINRW